MQHFNFIVNAVGIIKVCEFSSVRRDITRRMDK